MITRWLLSGLTGCLFATAGLAEEHTKDSLQTVKANVESKKAILVDVRDKQEWNMGHVASALMLPLTDLRRPDQIQTLVKDLPKDKIIYTHCVVGMRSLKAAEILKKQGFEVRALKPGYLELIQAGLPDAKGK